MRRAALPLFAALAALPAAAAAACSASSSPNPHDNVIDNTHPAPTSTGEVDAAPSGFPIVFDGGYYDAPSYAKPDGYSPVGTCKACNCTLNPSSAPAGDAGDDADVDAGPAQGPPGYCIGGLPGDIGPPASCAVTGTTLALGCNAVPAECAGMVPRDLCPCLLNHVSYGCYANCAVQGDNVAVYCPNP